MSILARASILLSILLLVKIRLITCYGECAVIAGTGLYAIDTQTHEKMFHKDGAITLKSGRNYTFHCPKGRRFTGTHIDSCYLGVLASMHYTMQYPFCSDVLNVNSTHCILPSSDGLFAEDTETKEIVREGGVLQEGGTYDYKCPPRHMLTGAQNDICTRGKLASEAKNDPPICSRRCDSRVVNRITTQAVCKYKNKIVSCDGIKLGTTANIECSYGYVEPEGQIHTITCLESGDWDNEPLPCVSDCGSIPARLQEFMIGGHETTVINVPWQAAIYKKNQSGGFEHICGGSIITANLVVTAAHCLWDGTLHRKKNPNLFMVSVGKTQRDYHIKETMFAPQSSSILEYQIADYFEGNDHSYIADIAVLVLKDPVKFKKIISPICLERRSHENWEIKSDLLGTIAGWGSDETGQPSASLKYIDLPSISKSDCQALVGVDYKSSVTADKFCVSSDEQKNTLCTGDSGGGFAVKRNNKYYLEGAVSTGLKFPEQTCGDFFYTTFTNIQYHMDLIDNLNKKYMVL